MAYELLANAYKPLTIFILSGKKNPLAFILRQLDHLHIINMYKQLWRRVESWFFFQSNKQITDQ